MHIIPTARVPLRYFIPKCTAEVRTSETTSVILARLKAPLIPGPNTSPGTGLSEVLDKSGQKWSFLVLPESAESDKTAKSGKSDDSAPFATLPEHGTPRSCRR